MEAFRRYMDDVRHLNCSSTTAIGIAATAAASALAVTYMMSRPKPVEYCVDMESQSRLLEDGSRVSHFSAATEGPLTLHEGFKRGIIQSKNGPCLGTIKQDRSGFEWTSYQEVFDRAQRLGSELLSLGLKPHPGQDPQPENIVGIFSQNREEWVVTEQAANMFSLVLVPLYDTLGIQACQFIAKQTEMKILVCDNGDKVSSILPFIDQTPSLKHLIVMDMQTVTKEQLSRAQRHGVKITSFTDSLQGGKEKLREPVPPTPDEIVTICYTSGTTGDPKGVLISHANIVTNACAVQKLLIDTKCIELCPDDCHLSYLPLAHNFERSSQAFLFMNGVKIGFFSGDVKKLVDDLKLLRPSYFPTVPRLLNRMYDKVMAGVSESRLKSLLLKIGLRSKQSEVDRGVIRRDSIWDHLIFSKIQQSLGGRVRLILVGSAPLASNVLSFCRCAFGCPILEGYGQTEANAAITLTVPGESTPGHVGPPVIGVAVKLVDIPEMEYYASEGRGEICAKGTNIMVGYFREPAKTAEAIDEDGWLHTGDVGEWTKQGTLKIIDRKKHIFKLAQGEYLAPEKIENIYTRSSMVAQVFVDGNSLRAFLVAIVVPDPEVLPGVAQKNGISGSMEELCKSEALKQMILDDIVKQGKESGLKSFEQVKDIYLFPEMFSIDNSLLTPTFKLKRPVLRKYFKSIIDEMYEKRQD